MIKRNASSIIGILVIVFVSCEMIAAQEEATKKSLYHRLGGYDVIASIVYDFANRFDADPLLKPMIVGFSEDSGRRQVQMFIEFFCEQAGGPCFYIGRDMKTTHAGITITETHWKVFMGHLEGAIDAAKIPAKEKAESLAIFNKFKSDIITE